ncbi:hypothetical protein L0244_20090 [bacterium]|nr:hypothetical protein [bacterium]MCI0615299.1 hypothetical protein [bacterium]
MTKQSVNEQTAVEYLLGGLSEQETERLDELVITDHDFMIMLKALENDLIDQYVRGELTGNKLQRFKSQYLTSSKRREKVKFAQSLLPILNAPSIEESPSRAPGFRTRWFNFGVGRSAFQWGLAAIALFLLFTTGYLIFENMNLRSQFIQVKSEQSALKIREQELERELAKQKSLDNEKANELVRVRERLKQLEEQLAGSEPPDVKLIAFNLSPQTRGTNKIRQLEIPSKIDSINFNLNLEADEFSIYRVTLKNPETNEVLWRSNKAKASANTVKVTLPANLLKGQSYILEVYGILGNKNSELVSNYLFRISKQP